MYKSPLQAFYKEQTEKVDDLCYRRVLSVGINVDREELLKALAYDRGQYEKGYEDGKNEGVVHCKDCEYWTKQVDSLQGRCALGGHYPTGNWYCANGERRNDG